jgi:hypothetical protein
MRLIIGYGHRARQGKDSAAYAIQDYARRFSLPDVRIFKFATALYQECEEHHGMIGKDAPLLQKVGLQRRQQNENYWIDRLKFAMGDFKGISLITDVRFKNEAQWIRDNGGFLVDVTRLNSDSSYFIATDRPADHPSETELDHYDFDAYIVTKTGQQALAAEIAITQFNYFYELTRAEAAQWA